MPCYRVTYVESGIREVYVTAKSEEAAEELVRAAQENAEHHHMIDFWHDDWRVEPAKSCSANRKPKCLECG